MKFFIQHTDFEEFMENAICHLCDSEPNSITYLRNKMKLTSIMVLQNYTHYICCFKLAESGFHSVLLSLAVESLS